MRYRRLAASVFAATLLLGVGTVGLAVVPPRPLRSAMAVVYALSVRVGADWLAVVALLAVAERYVSDATTVDRSTVTRLAGLVFAGGFAVEAAPLARLVVESGSVATGALVRGVVGAVHGALFPAALFVATVLGAATLRASLPGGATPGPGGRIPLAPGSDGLPSLKPAAVWRVARVLGVAAGAAFVLDLAARVALGDPYVWLSVADAAVGALGGLADSLVLAVAFLALAAEGVRVRSLAGGVVGVWAGVVVLSFAIAALGAGVAVGLVGATVTPMAAVEASTLGEWPTPDSWAVLLRLATFAAGGIGLLTVQRGTAAWRETATETDASDTHTE